MFGPRKRATCFNPHYVSDSTSIAFIMSFQLGQTPHDLPIERVRPERLHRYNHSFVHFVTHHATNQSFAHFLHELTNPFKYLHPLVRPFTIVLTCHLSLCQLPLSHYGHHSSNVPLYPANLTMIHELPGFQAEAKIK
jgi:hypothetical protein